MFKLIMEVDLIDESGISWDIHIFFQSGKRCGINKNEI